MTVDKFAVFILSHGRPNNVKTYTTIRKQGFSGDVYIVIDNEDKTADQYKARFGDKVIVFDKAAVAATFDECDNFSIGRKSVVYARNACFDIAKNLGIQYFLELDDDYQHFEYRFNEYLKPTYRHAYNLDKLFKIILDYYKSIPVLTLAIGQGGDLIGGAANQGTETLHLKRKAMNTFFCSVDRPFKFIGRINEDVNTYVSLGNKGQLLITMLNASIVQATTQMNAGGMSDIYRDNGTYVKSFYTVMNNPSCVFIQDMGETRRRLHHHVDWSKAVPVIMSEQHRKVSN